MTTISYGGGPAITPTLALIDTATTKAEPRTVVHDILDGPPVYTLRAASPLTGRLELAFLDETAATDCRDAHMLASVFDIASADHRSLNFRYVVTGGDIELAPDDETVAGWVVTIPYQQVI